MKDKCAEVSITCVERLMAIYNDNVDHIRPLNELIDNMLSRQAVARPTIGKVRERYEMFFKGIYNLKNEHGTIIQPNTDGEVKLRYSGFDD